MISDLNNPQGTDEVKKIRKYALLCSFLWTLLLSSLFAAYVIDNRHAVLEIGHSMAQVSVEKDILFRHWATRHGGIYVPVTAATPANAYLTDISERDITTPTGRRLTLINPAYMTRQLYELAREEAGLPQGHITSLNPIRPENEPDAWEKQALVKLSQGVKQLHEPVMINGQPYLRYIQVLSTEKSCLKCHAAQGYKEGDERGGISVTLSLAPIYKTLNWQLMQEIVFHSLIWLLGLGLIWVGSQKIIRTMTSLRNERNKLSESEEQLRIIFETTESGIILVSPQGVIDFANSRMAEMFGMALPELIGTLYSAHLHERELDSCRERMRLLAQGAITSLTLDRRYLRSDGEEFWGHLSAKRLENSDGSLRALVGVISDINERKQAEVTLLKIKEDLHERNDALLASDEMLRVQINEYKEVQEQLTVAKSAADAANTAKSQFLANMSHEIRTPMNGILGLAEILLGTELTGDQRNYAELIKKSGRNLVQLISDILDLSKIEANRIELEIYDFDLQSETDDTINLLLLRDQVKSLDLRAQIDPDVPRLLKGDAGRLRQIIINLIGNAIKFTEEGSVVLHICKEDEDEQRTTLRFLIQDSGIGIAHEKLETIFEPFTQADVSVNRKFGGTGLGLAISRQLAEAMGGAVGVESVEGEGTTFWFTVVFEKQAPEAGMISVCDRSDAGVVNSRAYADLSAVMPASSKIRLLLAEDDAINQLVTKSTLEKFGYCVDVASSGQESLKLLSENDYALVLMDCMMPMMNGYEATIVIRDRASTVRNHNIPVVALTANAMREDRDNCLAAGMNDYLSKPYEVEELLLMLEKWIDTSFYDSAKSTEPETELTTMNVFSETSVPPNHVFDWDEFIGRSMGDLELSHDVATLFITSAPEYINSIRRAQAARDVDALRQSAHKLSGAAANLALPQLSATARKIETIARAGDQEKAMQLLPELELRFAQALTAIQEQLIAPQVKVVP